MTDFIRIMQADGNLNYINLENIIEVKFIEHSNKIEFLYGLGVCYVTNPTKEGFQILKDKINKEMEKRMLP